MLIAELNRKLPDWDERDMTIKIGALGEIEVTAAASPPPVVNVNIPPDMIRVALAAPQLNIAEGAIQV